MMAKIYIWKPPKSVCRCNLTDSIIPIAIKTALNPVPIRRIEFIFYHVIRSPNSDINSWITSFKFTRNVEYVKYHEPIYRTIRKFVTATGSNDIDIAGFQISFPSMGVAVQRQRHDYTPSQAGYQIDNCSSACDWLMLQRQTWERHLVSIYLKTHLSLCRKLVVLRDLF